MPMAAGEVKDPGRNVPIALIGGMAVVMVIYCAREPRVLLRLAVRRGRHREFDALPGRAAGCDEGGADRLRRGRRPPHFAGIHLLRARRAQRRDVDRRPRAVCDGARWRVLLESRRAQPSHARSDLCASASGRVGQRPRHLRHIRSAVRLCDLRVVDFLRPGHVVRIRLATKDARRGAAVQNAGLSGHAARASFSLPGGWLSTRW